MSPQWDGLVAIVVVGADEAVEGDGAESGNRAQAAAQALQHPF